MPAAPRAPRAPSSVEHDGHRPVVDELDVHLRAEDARFHRHAECAQRGTEPLVERLRLHGRRSLGEARPVALRGVRDQRELRDGEHGTGNVFDRAVEPAVGVGEDPQPGDLAREPRRLLLPIAAGDAEQDAETAADRAAGCDPGARDALHHGSHAQLVELADARAVLVRSRPQRARELVVPVRLEVASLLLQAAAERVVRVVVVRRELQQLAELFLGLAPPPDPEVRDPERLADRSLVRLAPLRLLEREARLGRHDCPQMTTATLEEAVGRLTHRYPIPVPAVAVAPTAAGRVSERSERRPRMRSRRLRLRRAISRRACSSRFAVRAAAAASSGGPKRAAVAAATNASGWTANSRRKRSPSSPSVALRGVSTRWSTRNEVSSCRQAAATPRGSRRAFRVTRKPTLVNAIPPPTAARAARRSRSGRLRSLPPPPPRVTAGGREPPVWC